MYPFFMFISILAIAFGLMYHQIVLLMVSLSMLFVFYMSSRLMNLGKRNLELDIIIREKAYFRNQSFSVLYVLNNPSFLVQHVKLKLVLHKSISVKGLKSIKKEGLYHHYHLDLWIAPKSRINQPLSFTINKRGNYYFGDVSLVIYDLFSLKHIEKLFQLNKEIAIYPNIFLLDQLQKQPYLHEGARISQFALLENKILPKGARDYLPTDPFSKIDWKISGKYRRLYSREFERTTNEEVWIIGNLRTNDQTWMDKDENKIEQVISTVASLAYRYSKFNQSYEIILNARLARLQRLYRLHGSKKQDLSYTLYQLAKLWSYTTVDVYYALQKVQEDATQRSPLIILVSTYLSEQVEKKIMILRKQGKKIIWINPIDINQKVENNGESKDPLEANNI